jgi:hypothetical protein
MTITEIHEFWTPLHEQSKIKGESLKKIEDNAEALSAYTITALLKDNEQLLSMFLSMENGLDARKADELVSRLTCNTKLAEYIHMKIADMDFMNVAVFIEVLAGENSYTKYMEGKDEN